MATKQDPADAAMVIIECCFLPLIARKPCSFLKASQQFFVTALKIQA